MTDSHLSVLKTISPREVTPQNPLEEYSKIDRFLRDWIPPPEPPAKEVEIMTLKNKTTDLSTLKWPESFEGWKTLQTQKIKAGIFVDLWKACELSVNGLKTNYHDLYTNLLEEEKDFCQRNPNVLLDVRGGMEGLWRSISSAKDSSKRSEKTEEITSVLLDRQVILKNMTESTSESKTIVEPEGEKELVYSSSSEHEKNNFSKMDDEEFIEEVKEVESSTMCSLAFEFSRVVGEALDEFKANPKACVQEKGLYSHRPRL